MRNSRLMLCYIFSYDVPKIRNLPKIFLRSFENVSPGQQIWGQKIKGQGHWERKYKNRFRAYLRQKWVDLRQTKTKIIHEIIVNSLDTYRRIYFVIEKVRLFQYLFRNMPFGYSETAQLYKGATSVSGDRPIAAKTPTYSACNFERYLNDNYTNIENIMFAKKIAVFK